ncbi:MAG: Ig-like domain-containing protein [Lachnospiraceae bacterium]|nr:Ig-like domain-containing protein [Lachnospiraceae bacterium]
MRRKKSLKVFAVVLATTLFVATVPAVATENVDTQSEETTEESVMEVTEEANTDLSVGMGEETTEEQSDVETPEETEPEPAQVEESVPVTLAADELESGPVESVSVSPKSATLNVVGQTTQLTADILPEGAEYSIEWSSASTSVAKVDKSSGLVTAGSKSGTAKVTATVTYTDDAGEQASITGTCTITVSLYNGLYQDPNGSDWYYYKNGQVNTGKTGVVSGTVDGTSGQWNIVKGKLKREADVVKYNGDWWYFNANGMLDTSYTGFAKNSNGTWYMEKGKLERDENSVIKDSTGALGSKSDWYYVIGSKVQTSFTGLADYRNSSGWWYITKGKVDRSVTTVAKNKNGWYYVNKGKVDSSYTGFASNSKGKWYVSGGKVSKTKNGVLQDSTGAIGATNNWYYVLNSKVQTSFTGLANYRNSKGWWYITNGKVDRSYNGLAKNKNGWFYLTNGKVNRSYTGFAKNSSGDWYVSSGKVTKNYTSVVRDDKGVLGAKGNYYYVKNNKVRYDFTGIASNSKGSWYIKNGKLDRSYNGTYTYNGTTYTVTNGKATTPYADLGMSSTMYNKAQSQTSATKWLVMVDVDNCKVGIFQGSQGNWVPKKCWTCTTGAPSTPTVRGTWTIYDKGLSFGDGYTCWYYNRFHNGYMLHSILYNPGSMSSVQDGRLGMHLSHGCVRVSLTNAKWVYDNVPYSTRLVTY